MSALSCRACAGALVPWREVAAGEPSDRRRHLLLRCTSCGSAITAGDPPGAELYESGVYAPGEPRAAALVALWQRASVGRIVRLLRRGGLPPRARVLDAGAGRGRLVLGLRDAGLEASGIEPSARGAELAGAAGAPVERGAIEEHAAEGLDAVVLWHVLEHLEDPLAALRRIRSWLRPGGVLLLGVPNRASLQARIGGAGWLHFDAPRHRVHLTPRGLRELLVRAGFEPGPVSHVVWEHNPHAMWMALLTRMGMTPGLPFHLLKRNVRPRRRDLALLAAGIPLLPVALALELAAAATRRGGTVAALARSPGA